MKPTNSVLSLFGTTIFEVMSRLAIEHKSVNLGQGFPDGNGPDDVRAMAHDALDNNSNQYPPMMGVPELRQALADHDKRFYDIDVDWQRETIVASGATEVLAAALFGLLDQGDEIIMFEPLYDSYIPIARLAGATVKLVRLEPPDWRLPLDELAAAFGPKTKAVLINSPLNPAGKVFTRAELEAVASLVKEHDCYAICDEVYEHIIFDDTPHIPLMTLPGMRDRCIRIGSAGKTFSVTGWKVGYGTASPEVMAPVAKAHQFLTFTTPPNFQHAVAYGLKKDDAYFDALSGDMQASRDRLAQGLTEIGFAVAPCKGTYFLNADFRPLGFNGTDEEFCRHITVDAGVTGVPVSAFYMGGDGPSHFARFCFCKEDATLDEALRRLKAHFS
jgi:N-succinyldiaminopimelate aminotransferase